MDCVIAVEKQRRGITKEMQHLSSPDQQVPRSSGTFVYEHSATQFPPYMYAANQACTNSIVI